VKLKHVLTAGQFTDVEYLKNLFHSADELEKADQAGKVPQSLKGKIVATLFFEPSTRTRLSFEAAALKLGGQVISAENARESLSFGAKGETLQDTVKIVNSYAEAIIIRHHEVGGAESAAKVSEVPVINAGDGEGEHPTQALGDVYTIQKELGKLDGLNIALVGDLKYGRTVHSLLPMLGLYQNINIYLISPPQLSMPEQYKRSGMNIKELDKIDDVLGEVDVLYVTRVQKERFALDAEYQKLKGSYVIGRESINKLKKDAIVMHPLPRVDEIAAEVDSDPRAAYFRQARNGLYLRMALLQEILAE
jgi:aspartate carbamoyltransferase catalytic subunit